METSQLCMLCCCAFTDEPFKNLGSVMITKAHLVKFCKEMDCGLSEKSDDAGNTSDKNGKRLENNLLGGVLNLDYQKVSICPDCLHHISATNEMRTEMNKVEENVRNLQWQLLKALEKLKEVVGHFYNKMKKHNWLHMNQEDKNLAIENGMKEPYNSKNKPREFQFHCATCGKSFHSKCSLNGHEARMHTVRERITFSKCGKLLLKGASMWYHDLTCTKRDTGQVFECLVCQKTYQNKFLLRQHQRLYHRADGHQKFVCDQCGKCFKLKRHLVAHEAVHLDSRPYACKGKGCNKSFKWQRVLRQHETTCKMLNSK